MAPTLFAREVVAEGPSALPLVDSRVTLSPVLTAGAVAERPVEVPTRVEDLRLQVRGRRAAPAELVIVKPAFAGDLYGESAGCRYLVRWLTDRGVHEVPARFVEAERIGPRLMGWRLRLTGPVRRVQRRAHARVAIAVPVELRMLQAAGPGLPPPVRVARGLTLNLSEGGMLAALVGGAPAVGSPLTTRFTVAGEAFLLAGRVVRHQPAPGRPSDDVAVALAFSTPDTHGDRLRPLLFAHQLRSRRAGVS